MNIGCQMRTLSLPNLNSSRPRRTLSSFLYLGNKCRSNRGLPFKVPVASWVSSSRQWMLVLPRERPVHPCIHRWFTGANRRRESQAIPTEYLSMDVDIWLAHICCQKASRPISTMGSSHPGGMESEPGSWGNLCPF